MPVSPRLGLAVLIVLSLLGAVSVPARVDARAPPTPVCGVCGEALVGAAANHGSPSNAARRP